MTPKQCPFRSLTIRVPAPVRNLLGHIAKRSGLRNLIAFTEDGGEGGPAPDVPTMVGLSCSLPAVGCEKKLALDRMPRTGTWKEPLIWWLFLSLSFWTSDERVVVVAAFFNSGLPISSASLDPHSTASDFHRIRVAET
ncbi:hypothetical protein MUK42_32790 [Musa troglodytarum]|uniref:Uncharacterized protein n=1 Tax=Musa troglodytarum TaxID=320322 RepID=A0A9E7JTH4_9LILI|nr:hypothetical protein MUK42_32790 [Musa troglodytarum]